jgi:sulfite exporter TauE/SafE
MDQFQFEDRLEVLGLLAGAFLVLMGLGTIAGQPWTYFSDPLPAIGRVVGSLLAIAVGVGIAWVVRTDAEPVA